MIFRYDFGKNLDLSRFRKQSTHYIGKLPTINYHFFVGNYKMIADINVIEEQNLHNVTIAIFDITKDNEGQVKDSNTIVPLMDVRFKEIKEIISIFPNDYMGEFSSDNSEFTSNKLCQLIKILHKIDSLKAFI